MRFSYVCADIRHELAFPADAGVRPLFAYIHGAAAEATSVAAGWARYNYRREMARLGIPNSRWRISTLNADYSVAPTYPALIAVPATITDTAMIEASKFRSKNRMQGLSWLHPSNGASLTRCSQPRVGTTGKRSAADEALVTAIREVCCEAGTDACNELDALPLRGIFAPTGAIALISVRVYTLLRPH